MRALSKRALGAALMEQHIAFLPVPFVKVLCMSMSRIDLSVSLIILLILPSKVMSIC